MRPSTSPTIDSTMPWRSTIFGTHVHAIRADRHANADFARPPRRRIRDQAVETDDRKRESHQAHRADGGDEHADDANRCASDRSRSIVRTS